MHYETPKVVTHDIRIYLFVVVWNPTHPVSEECLNLQTDNMHPDTHRKKTHEQECMQTLSRACLGPIEL